MPGTWIGETVSTGGATTTYTPLDTGKLASNNAEHAFLHNHYSHPPPPTIPSALTVPTTGSPSTLTRRSLSRHPGTSRMPIPSGTPSGSFNTWRGCQGQMVSWTWRCTGMRSALRLRSPTTSKLWDMVLQQGLPLGRPPAMPVGWLSSSADLWNYLDCQQH